MHFVCDDRQSAFLFVLTCFVVRIKNTACCRRRKTPDEERSFFHVLQQVYYRPDYWHAAGQTRIDTGTDYKAYVVVVDAAGNKSALATATFTTN